MIAAIVAALRLAAGLLPAPLQAAAGFILNLLGSLNLPVGDPRAERVGQIVAGLLDDLADARELAPDLQMAFRLTIEHKAHKLLAEFSGGTV